jgi:hypothetical protein
MRFNPFAIAGLVALAIAAAHAADYKAGSLVIADPWSRATPKGRALPAGT